VYAFPLKLFLIFSGLTVAFYPWINAWRSRAQKTPRWKMWLSIEASAPVVPEDAESAAENPGPSPEEIL
jgi:hypothetical protein